jgi:hypothetical protein
MKRQDDGSWAPKFDLSNASDFGEIEFIFGHGNVALQGSSMREAALERLNDFDEELDFILPVGDPCLVGVVKGVLYEIGVERSRWLRWDGAAKRYDVVMI